MSNTMRDHDLKIREATSADLETIMRHRRHMFMDMGYKGESALDAMETTSRPFIGTALGSGLFRGWFVEMGGKVVAGGALIVLEFPSSPRDHSTHRAWILNMYTEPEYRGRGLATSLMETMIKWCRERGFKWVSLHASDAGRPLYETLGFKPTNEMRLMLK
jgi:GNAT superfamily N-acetyltransferase